MTTPLNIDFSLTTGSYEKNDIKIDGTISAGLANRYRELRLSHATFFCFVKVRSSANSSTHELLHICLGKAMDDSHTTGEYVWTQIGSVTKFCY